MTTGEFFEKWYAAFASGAEPVTMSRYVRAEGGCPWHIFTHARVGCVVGDEAISAYKKAAADEVFCYVGRDYEHGAVEKRKNDLGGIMRGMAPGDEVYIAVPDLSWTFVWTHEQSFGPYFAERQDWRKK